MDVHHESRGGATSQPIVGYDPGGNGKHGLAVLRVRDGIVEDLATETVDTAESVLRSVNQLSSVTAIGVDTLTCWSTGRSGLRPADRWLLKQFPTVSRSVLAPNSLSGAMAVNGMAVLEAVTRRIDDVFVTETHPKILYWRWMGARYDYESAADAMDAALAERLNREVETGTEHEWDAAASAYAALEGATDRWSRDLHALPTDVDERLVTPCGPTHFSWPE